jgi:hypothetical protein
VAKSAFDDPGSTMKPLPLRMLRVSCGQMVRCAPTAAMLTKPAFGRWKARQLGLAFMLAMSAKVNLP